MIRLVRLWLTLLIFLSSPAVEGNVRFGDFTIAAESESRLVNLTDAEGQAHILDRPAGRGHVSTLD